MIVLLIQQLQTKPHVVVTVYRPPQGTQKVCLDTVRVTLQMLKSANNVTILGDMNIDYKQKDTVAVKEIKSLEREFNLRQRITEPTRETSTTSIIIDHILTNAVNVVEAGVIRTSLSDHFMTFLLIKKQHVMYERTTFVCRQLTNFDEEKLSVEIEKVDWNKLYRIKDIDQCWQFIYDALLKILDDLCPEKTYENV